MLKKLFIIFILSLNLYSIGIVSNDNYKIYNTKLYTIVYSEEYEKEAIFIKNNIDNFFKENDRSFAYKFDEKVHIVLASNKTQIANAFSTQSPFNINVNYNGGSGHNTYFANKSWLKTIFIHEMIHNYQINAKKSKISKTLHKFFRNNYQPIFTGIPLFTIPNAFLPTALLEGNSVYNESLYKNGGRLFNGSLNALKNTLLFDNKINPTRFINDHLYFPYGTEKYIVGGFYMKYMSELHGHNKVNEFFYEHSIHSINPFLLSKTFKKVFNTNFENSVKSFVDYSKKKYSTFNIINEKTISSSKSEIQLSKIEDEIYFITTNLINKKELNILDINNNVLTKENTTLENTKLFKFNNKIYSNTSKFINTKEIKYALFDEDSLALKSTIGKFTHDIKNENHAYIDINSSFNSSKLFVNNKFINTVSSNALFDKNNNIYYFKQQNDQRVLYKNKKELHRFNGYFSKLVEIIDNEVYFIANTKNGSTLYKFSDGIIFSLSTGENIINAKILSKTNALVVLINSNEYTVSNIKLNEKKKNVYYEEIKHERKDFVFNENVNDQKLRSKNYNEIKQLKLSSIYPSIYSDSENGTTVSVNSMFADPLLFNMSNIYLFKNNEKSIVGANYINQRYTLPFLLNIYNIDRNVTNNTHRNFGANIKILAPLINKANHNINLDFNKYFDDSNKNKNPNILNMNYSYAQNFGLESSAYIKNKINVFVKEDRDDLIYGVNAKTNKHIYKEFYINAQILSYKSDTKKLLNQRGIKIVSDNLELQNDASNVFIHNFDDNYVKSINKFSLGISKSLHISKYFSKFLFSLRKESIFYTKNIYKLKNNSETTINEDILGINLDLLLVHKLNIPITIKFIKNNFLNENININMSTGFKF